MRSINAYEAVKSTLKDLASDEGYYFIEPILEDGQSVSLFPMITMENGVASQEHGERGRQENLEILVMFAVRGTQANVIELLNAVEKKVKQKLYADRTLSDNVRFFDYSILSRDYTSGQGGICVGWAEGSLTGQVAT